MIPSIPLALRAGALQSADILDAQDSCSALGICHGCATSSRFYGSQKGPVRSKYVHGAFPIEAVVHGTHNEPILIYFDAIWHTDFRCSPEADRATGLRGRHPPFCLGDASPGVLERGESLARKALRGDLAFSGSTFRQGRLCHRFSGRQDVPAGRVVGILYVEGSRIRNVDRQKAPLGSAAAPDRGRVLGSVDGQGNPVKRFGSRLIAHKCHLIDAGPESAPLPGDEQPKNYEFATTIEVEP